MPARLIAAEFDQAITVKTSDTTYHLTHRDVKEGELLFYGLMRDQQGEKACVSCHNVQPEEQFNWNPSAMDIAAAIRDQSFNDFKVSLYTPVGKRLGVAHAGYGQLTDEELAQMKGYLLDFYRKGGYHPKPIIDHLLYFLVMVIIFLLAFLDLVWFRVIRFRLIHTVILLATTILITKVIAEEAIALGRSKNFSPDQPIKFSHLVHAGQNKIDCQYCHNSAEYSKSAGIPSPSVCLNCHMIVREGTRSGRFEINKIFAALDNHKPIQWVRVYNLPDHAFFSHAQHVGAGKLKCQTCHGPVETMDRIVQVPDLSMGWCINCHRQTKVQFHDNKFYEKYTHLQEEFKKGIIDSVTVSMVGGTDCMKCHY